MFCLLDNFRFGWSYPPNGRLILKVNSFKLSDCDVNLNVKWDDFSGSGRRMLLSNLITRWSMGSWIDVKVSWLIYFPITSTQNAFKSLESFRHSRINIGNQRESATRNNTNLWINHFLLIVKQAVEKKLWAQKIIFESSSSRANIDN